MKANTTGWSQYSVDFTATVTSSQDLDNQARLTWWFRADKSTGGLPDNAEVWIAGATFKHMIEAEPDRVPTPANPSICHE